MGVQVIEHKVLSRPGIRYSAKRLGLWFKSFIRPSAGVQTLKHGIPFKPSFFYVPERGLRDWAYGLTSLVYSKTLSVDIAE